MFLEVCLVGTLVGLGYLSLGGEAATASALEDGLLEQKRDDDVASSGTTAARSTVGRRAVQMRSIERSIDRGERGSGAYDPHDKL